MKKIPKSVFVRILLFSIILNIRNFSSLDNIRARNPPFLETIARTNLPLLWDFIFLTTHRVWKIRYISRWRRNGNQLYLSRKTRTNLSPLKMLFLRRIWARKHLRNHSNIIFRHLRSINIFRNTLCKIRSHDINKLQKILYQYIMEHDFVENNLLLIVKMNERQILILPLTTK